MIYQSNSDAAGIIIDLELIRCSIEAGISPYPEAEAVPRPLIEVDSFQEESSADRSSKDMTTSLAQPVNDGDDDEFYVTAFPANIEPLYSINSFLRTRE